MSQSFHMERREPRSRGTTPVTRADRFWQASIILYAFLERGLWCNACGHRRDERKEMSHAPTSARDPSAARTAGGSVKPTVQHCPKCGKRGKALSYCKLCGWFIPITLAINPVTVTAKCIGCGATRQIRAGEVAPGDMPVCACGNVMIATKAEAA